MMYMKSVAGSDGVLITTVTFTSRHRSRRRPGAGAEPRRARRCARLPEDVRRHGVMTQKQSPDAHHGRAPAVAGRPLRRRCTCATTPTSASRTSSRACPASARPSIFGARRLRDAHLARPGQGRRARPHRRRRGACDPRAERAGLRRPARRAAPRRAASDFLLSINAQGRLADRGGIRRHRRQDRRRRRDHAPRATSRGSSSARRDYTLRSLLDNKHAVAVAIFQAPGANAIDLSDAVRAEMAELAKRFPRGRRPTTSCYDPTVFVARLDRGRRRSRCSRPCCSSCWW